MRIYLLANRLELLPLRLNNPRPIRNELLAWKLTLLNIGLSLLTCESTTAFEPDLTNYQTNSCPLH